MARERMPDRYIDEIRLNSNYTHLYTVDYPDETQACGKGEGQPVAKKKTVFTQDYIQRLQKQADDNLFLPPNCRYMEKTDKGTIVVIEEPPALRTITVQKSMEYEKDRIRSQGNWDIYNMDEWCSKSKKVNKFTLAFPYVVFFFVISDTYSCLTGQAYTRPAQMQGLSDYICKIPLLNISSSQSICFGDYGGKRQRSMLESINEQIMVFWSATFNTDYTYNYDAYRSTPVVGNYIEWQYMSQVNPMFVYTSDWIKYDYNITGVVEHLKSSYDMRSRDNMEYVELKELFTKPQDTNKTAKVSSSRSREHKLFYDICQGTYVGDDITANVGDTITTKKGEIAFIDSFIGFMNGGDIKYVSLDLNGKLIKVKWTQHAKDFMRSNLSAQRRMQETVLENGVVIKPKDIIVIKQPNGNQIYKKVNYIRKSRGEQEDLIEIRLGDTYYIANMLDAQKFDMNNPNIFGLALEPKEEVIIIKDGRGQAGAVNASSFKFKRLDIDTDRDSLVCKFESTLKFVSGSNYNLNMNETTRTRPILKMDEVEPLGPIFKHGRLIHSTVYDGMRQKVGAWGNRGRLLWDNHYNLEKPNRSESLLNDNKFSIKGTDFDTEFEVGDKVVVANWTTPIEVLNVKTITGFKHDTSNGNISFILMDKDQNLSEVLYVDIRQGCIYTGKVRKVTNHLDKISTGMKIQAKKTGIANFPKKDVNIVVAIIIDGPFEPLILCSNGCTLWYSTVMNDFTKTAMKSKKWATMQHSPLDPSKIKFQSGDIIVGQREYRNSFGYLVYGDSSRLLKATPLQYYASYPEEYTLDKYFQADAILDCIPNPRVSLKRQQELGFIPAFYDFHGGVIKHEASKFLLLNERGV